MSETQDLILNRVDDLISEFLYYGRKEDEELPRGVIEQAVKEGLITKEQIVAKFKQTLEQHI